MVSESLESIAAMVVLIQSSTRLPPNKVGMIVDRGHDFPSDVQTRLEHYGVDLWYFRDDKSRVTTRARNTYVGDSRGFDLSPSHRPYFLLIILKI